MSRTVVSRLARDYLRPHWARIAAAILCMIATAGCTAVTAWLLKPALDALFKAGQGDIGRLALISSAIVALSAFKAVLAYGAGILLADTVRRVTTRLQEQLFARLMHADLARLSEKHSGVHQTNFLQNTSVLATGVTTALVGVFRDFPTMVGLIAVMFYMDWELSLFALLIGPPVAYLARRLSKKAGKAMGGSIKNSNELAKRIAETLSGIRIVKAYGREDYEAARAAALIEGRTQQLFKAQRASLAAAPFTEAIGSIGIAGAIFYGGLRVFHHTLTPTAFLTFIGVMLQAFQPMRTLSNLATVFSQSVRAAQAIFEELDVDPTIEDAPGAKALVPAGVKGARIRFEDVSFSYGPEVPALNHIAFEVNPGETVALVGPSGAGKTTIFNLLLRFYEPTSGRVLIDDQDIRSVTIGSLRDQIALVAQEATLFDDTVAANISYGAKGQLGASPADIASAARHAAADDFITRLPRGYETRAGEDGGQLSGGQRQRIAIARAFLKDAPILLLDEATSALDTHSEAQVQAALSELMQGRTTFVIAHRLSTILRADRIYVLDQGRIIETGNHGELLKRGGLYASLYQRQFREGSSHEELAAAAT